MLSIFTNKSAMWSTTAMNKANAAMTTATQRLGTGLKINSAADDAAGLQISTRLQALSKGMGVAMSNISKSTSMLQTAEGMFDEMTNILYRMKDLATQAADDSNTGTDREALNKEFQALNAELKNITENTSYGSEKLIGVFTASVPASGAPGTSGHVPAVDASINGKLANELQFQIGATSGETLKVNVTGEIISVMESLAGLKSASGDNLNTASGASAALDAALLALNDIGTVRASFGSVINRLAHTSANLANMKDNTDLNIGTIRDTDYAGEVTTMTINQMLVQTSQNMLKSANSMRGLAMNMLGG